MQKWYVELHWRSKRSRNMSVLRGKISLIIRERLDLQWTSICSWNLLVTASVIYQFVKEMICPILVDRRSIVGLWPLLRCWIFWNPVAAQNFFCTSVASRIKSINTRFNNVLINSLFHRSCWLFTTDCSLVRLHVPFIARSVYHSFRCSQCCSSHSTAYDATLSPFSKAKLRPV